MNKAVITGENAIQLGADGVQANDKVYFGKYGTYAVPWFVLSVGSGSAFLLSEYLLGQSSFQTYDSGYYKGGALNAKMDDLYNGTNSLFTVTERSTITAKTNLGCVDGVIDDTNSPAVPTAHLYPLSYNEAKAQGWASDVLKARYRDTGSIGWWWLRSSINDLSAFCMNNDGHAYGPYVDCTYGVRPACNLDLSKVLFASAAVGGKPAGGLRAVPNYSGNEWKLTLKNSARSGFSITTKVLSGTSATVDYAGAQTGTNEYISAMIVDNGSVAYYGRIKSLPNAADDSGTVTIHIPSGVTLDADTQLRVFNEQFNGGRSATDAARMAYTDYASELKTVTSPQSAPIITRPTADLTVPVTIGKTATLSVTAENAAGYQWYINRGDGFEPISGATDASYATSPVTLDSDGYRYYCLVTGSGGSVKSPVFTLKVTEPIEIPVTGDSAVPALWLGILLLAGAGLAAILVLRRGRRDGCV